VDERWELAEFEDEEAVGLQEGIIAGQHALSVLPASWITARDIRLPRRYDPNCVL
jgi:hypothetical protein